MKKNQTNTTKKATTQNGGKKINDVSQRRPSNRRVARETIAKIVFPSKKGKRFNWEQKMKAILAFIKEAQEKGHNQALIGATEALLGHGFLLAWFREDHQRRLVDALPALKSWQLDEFTRLTLLRSLWELEKEAKLALLDEGYEALVTSAQKGALVKSQGLAKGSRSNGRQREDSPVVAALRQLKTKERRDRHSRPEKVRTAVLADRLFNALPGTQPVAVMAEVRRVAKGDSRHELVRKARLLADYWDQQEGLRAKRRADLATEKK